MDTPVSQGFLIEVMEQLQDRIDSSHGRVRESINELNSYLLSKKPGDELMVTYKHRNIVRQTRVILKEQPGMVLVSFERTGRTVTEDMKKIRASWFTSNTK